MSDASNANQNSSSVIAELTRLGLLPFNPPPIQTRSTTAIHAITIESGKAPKSLALSFRDEDAFRGLFARYAVSTVVGVSVRFRHVAGVNLDVCFALSRSGIDVSTSGYSRVRSLESSIAFSLVSSQTNIADYQGSVTPPSLPFIGKVADGTYLGVPEPCLYIGFQAAGSGTISAATLNLEITLTIDGHGVGVYFL